MEVFRDAPAIDYARLREDPDLAIDQDVPDRV